MRATDSADGGVVMMGVRQAMKRAGFAMVALLGLSTSASALIITGGPVYSLPGGGTCTVSGTPCTAGGALMTCSGVSLSSHTKVYFGVRADANINGQTMTGTAPTAASAAVFRILSTTSSTISYSSTTTITSAFLAPAAQTVTNRLVLTLTSGSASVVATGGTPANNASNGDINSLFQINSGSSFQVRVEMLASDASFGLSAACSGVYDPSHATFGGGGDVNKADLAFYYSDCGDGTVDSPEACDQGSGVNGTAGSCCSTTCTFKSNGTGCTDDGNVCTTDTCNGASAVCQHPAGNAGFTCRGAAGVCDTIETCTGASTSCPGDAKSVALCRASAGVCDLPESCNGIGNNCPGDAKSSAQCRASAGVCDLADSCDGVNDTCPSDAKSVGPCRLATGACDVAEVCNGVADTCGADIVRPNGFVCNGGSGDACDPDETCDGIATSCPSDTITLSGTVCRAGSGDSCDPDETCTGMADVPCPSDVVQSAATVCRSGSGDSCDPDELCPGSAGQTCPTDLVTAAATVCRAGSGDSCDPDEACTGTAGQACPTDTLEPPTTLCRPGSGDICDPDEFCPGVPAGSCAAEVVEPNTTVCRAAAGDCDAADLCTGTPGATCPSDAKQSASTICRPAVDACDVAEQCDGSSDTCPVNALQADNTPCPNGLFCDGVETCQSGVCTDQPDPCIIAEICNEAIDSCQTDACPATPQTCRTAVKSLLVIKNSTDNSKDKVIWKYIKGQATTQAEFADPTTSADYALCIYAGASPTLVGTIHVAPGALWKEVSTKGYKYKDQALTSDGTQKVLVKGTGVSGKTKALLVARGANAPDVLDAGMLAAPVTAQLINYENGLCWQGTYAVPVKNTSEVFKGKQ
ncbi:MAG: hypothetical protein ABI629_02860 [bacterium]